MKKYWFYNELNILFKSNKSWKEIIMNFITNLSSSKYKNYIYNAIFYNNK